MLRAVIRALFLAVGIAVTAGNSRADAQQAPPATRPGARPIAASDTTVTARLIREIELHQQAMRQLEYLTDEIGPRLTGSDRLVRAHAWAESTMTAAGLTNVHREAYDFGPSWTRGVESARLLTQNGAILRVAGIGWGPATPGPVRGDVVLLSGPTIDTWERMVGQFKGRFVLFGQFPQPGADSATFDARIARVMKAIFDEGALGTIRSAGKGEGLAVTGGPVWRLGITPKLPLAFMASKDVALLSRLLARGERVTIELKLPGTLSSKPVQAYNSIGEIRGSERPDEVVILGAHLDSWDLGTGATDNGTGVVAVMEALRAIKAAGLTPRRTIRVVLFSGEEQGHFGSKAYVAAHHAEMDQIQAALVIDLGSGKVRGFALQGIESARPLMARTLAPLNDRGVTELPLEKAADSDHASFLDAGVPAFFAVQDPLDYFTVTHHSEFDTFDRVRPEQLIGNAVTMAVVGWELANMMERLPRDASVRALMPLRR